LPAVVDTECPKKSNKTQKYWLQMIRPSGKSGIVATSIKRFFPTLLFRIESTQNQLFALTSELLHIFGYCLGLGCAGELSRGSWAITRRCDIQAIFFRDIRFEK
jgi:hypothetical protein